MNKNTIEYLAYILNQAREEDLPKAIVFLGAGASASSGIPLTHVIVRHIKMKYKKNPIIKEFISKNETDYYTIMGALTADERRDLFYFYVTRPKVKINVTNIYLAQLLKEGYIDFVLTVNFDDLLLRACALYNFLPPVYDISNISVPTTSNFREKSVIYLHGQHFGQWLLNKKEELDKSKNDITNIFNEIKNRRTWIVVGYSGQDEIFEQIASLGSFTKEFYWVNYKETIPNQKILDFVNDPNKNAHLLKGYDSDSFFLNLHSEISKLDNCNLETPEIFNKPFTFLQSMMEKVKDIDKYKVDKEYQETFNTIRERFENSKIMVEKAIDSIENNIENILEQEIIEAIINKDFRKADWFYNESLKYPYLKNNVANLFNIWGVQISEKAERKSDIKLFYETFEKYKKATELDDNIDFVFYNWGTSLYRLGKLTLDNKKLYMESMEKFKIAVKINPKNDSAYFNLGTVMSELAKLEGDKESYEKCMENFEKASEINSKRDDVFNNWGTSLIELAKLKNDENLYIESFEKFKKAIELNSNNSASYSNWGTSICLLAKLKNDRKLFLESNEKLIKAISLNAKDGIAYNNLASNYLDYSRFTENLNLKKELFLKAKKYAMTAVELGENKYNLACAVSQLGEKQNAYHLLDESLKQKEISKEHVLDDKDWSSCKNDPEFLKILSKY